MRRRCTASTSSEAGAGTQGRVSSLKKDAIMTVVSHSWSSSTIRLGKWTFGLDEAIGSPYGSRFELVRGRLEPRVYRSIEEENEQFHAGKMSLNCR